jgi:hypothetical protein
VPTKDYTCSTAAAKLGVTPTRVRALIAAQRLKVIDLKGTLLARKD